jgi:large repetitive protein
MRPLLATVLVLLGTGAVVLAAPPAGATSAAPSITTFSPQIGLSSGGTNVTIFGTSLDGASVRFDGTPAVVLSDTSLQLVVLTPSHAPGAAVISVTTGSGTTSSSTSFDYLKDVTATWNGSPDTSCHQWFTATPPTGALTAVATLSGAGGGGTGYDKGEHPTGGHGALVTTTLTGSALTSPMSVETGCGGGSGKGGLVNGYPYGPEAGGSGFGSGGSGGLAVGVDGTGYTGGGGGGGSALCLGSGTCTSPVAVAGGGGGAGAEDDCDIPFSSEYASGGSGGSGSTGATQSTSTAIVSAGNGGDTGDDGHGGGGGGTGGGSGGGGYSGMDGSGGATTPWASDGGPGAATGNLFSTASGGGGGGGYTAGGGGGGDGCIAEVDIFDVEIGWGNNAAGGGGAASSAVDPSVTDGVAFGSGASGGVSTDSVTSRANTSCPMDGDASIPSGCPGYVSLVYGVSVQPTVTSVSPTYGPVGGGNHVTVQGTNLSDTSQVLFNGVPSPDITVQSSTSIDAVAPSGTGRVDVTVETPEGDSAITSADVYRYQPSPIVSGIQPDHGPLAGGTSVLIDGSDFTGTSGVSFGSQPATSFAVDNPQQITATAPAGSGTVDVTVTTGEGTSSTSLYDQFTYVPVPTVTGVQPGAGSTGGYSSVTVTGTDFTDASGGFYATGVFFGGVRSLITSIVSPTEMVATAPIQGPGTVDVTVATSSGASPVSAADRFTYVSPPTVTGLTPSSGAAAGGTTVAVDGTGFTGATAVSFGAIPATFSVVSDTRITAQAPPGSGTVDVTVTSTGGASPSVSADQFTYHPPPVPPVVTGIQPASGPEAGGTGVTITGSGLTGAIGVDFGGVPARSVVVVSDTQVTATAPAGTGTIDVTVTTPVGRSASSASDRFTYLAPPHVTGVAPASGPTTGTAITIDGTDLAAGDTVYVGGVAATGVSLAGGQLHATTPGAAPGTADVTVVGPGGTSPTGPADRFTYLAAPVITGVTPDQGPEAGGATVQLTGTAFTDVQSVQFGTVAATGFTVVNAGLIVATAPPGTGSVDVTVTTPGGTSPPGSADQYTYEPPPVVTGVQPPSGPDIGGTSVDVTGTALHNATAVAFGGSPAVFSVLSGTDLRVTVPPGTGTVDVTVTTPGGTSATSGADQYQYLPVPTVATVAPATGLAAGGGQVTVTGTGFTGFTWVSFGGRTATGVSVSSSTSLTATVPGGSGTVDVSVLTVGGYSVPSPGDRYTYIPVPAVQLVRPADGPVAGGTSVTVDGTGFTGASAVEFGTVAVTSFTVVSPDVISATAPPGTGTVDVTVVTPGGTSPAVPNDRFHYGATTGYWEAAADGGVFTFGDAAFHGSMGGTPLAAPVVGLAPTEGGAGYWEAAADGGVFAFGDATFEGSMGGTPLAAPVVGMAPTADGGGYWLVGSDGGVFAFGDATFEGSMGGTPLAAPVVGMAPTADGGGYWLVGSDGGVFAFGDANFEGSMGGTPLAAPVVGMAPTPDGGGYWLVGSDGGVFAFGDASYFGSMGGTHLDAPMVGMAPTPDGGGYWLSGADGGVFAFGDASYLGSMGGTPLDAPVVGVAGVPTLPTTAGPQAARPGLLPGLF